MRDEWLVIFSVIIISSQTTIEVGTQNANFDVGFQILEIVLL